MANDFGFVPDIQTSTPPAASGDFGFVPDGQPSATPAAPQSSPGFFQSAAQTVAQPFLQGARLPLGIIQKGIGHLTGSQPDIKRGSELAGNMPADFGPLGKVNAPGYDANGQPLGFGRSTGQAVGAGFQIAPWMMGAGEVGATVNGGVKTLGNLALRGAGTGAAAGASGGFGGALQGQSETGNYDPMALAGSTATGAATGAFVGAAVEPTLGKFAGKIGTPLDSEQATQQTWDMIKPKLSTLDQAEAVKNGQIVSNGKLGTIDHIPQPGKTVNGVFQPSRDMQMIETAKPYVVGAKNEIEAVSNMQDGIAKEAQQLRSGLAQSKAIWNINTLKGAINGIDRPDLLSSDATLNGAFTKTIARVFNAADTAPRSLDGLLDVRQALDRTVAKQYPNLYDSNNTPLRSAVTEVRNAINDQIERQLPAGKTVDGISYKESLKKQSLLYDAIDNAATNAPKVGSNNIGNFFKDHPTAGKVLKYGAEGAGIGGGIKILGNLLGGGNSGSTTQ